MKKLIILFVVLGFAFFIISKQKTQDSKVVTGKYPWQVDILSNGRSRVFDIVLSESTLKEVDNILRISPIIALYESQNKLSLEAYYKNASLGGMIGSFIFTLNASAKQLNKIKQQSHKKEKTKNGEIKYLLDKAASTNAKKLQVINLIYIPTVQLDEETIISRFGKPAHKIKLKNKEAGWHYLYPEKGLDLIYKEEGKEVLQYVLPKNFNALLVPLQSH